MATNTQIAQDQWQDFFIAFSQANRGRQISLDVIDQQAGGIKAINQGELLTIDFNPADKVNEIVVKTVEDEVGYAHTIEGPVEVWQAQHDGGEVGALGIIDRDDAKTLLRFT